MVKPVTKTTYRKRRKPAPPPPPPKHWWESKVVMFNAGIIVLSVITAGLPALQDKLSPEMYELAMAIFALVNAVLRFVTYRPIKQSNQGRQGNDDE